MKIRLLGMAVMAGLSFAHAASAQEFDDRWYLTGSAGMNIQDSHRETRNAPFGTLGVGKFLNENWSLDGELNYQNPNFEDNQDLNWSQYGISLDLRRHFTAEGRDWAPYILMGLGYQRSEEEFLGAGIPAPLEQREEGNLAAKVGIGIQSGLFGKRAALRTELAYRADFDDRDFSSRSGSSALNGDDRYGDLLASIGVVIPLGAPATAAVPPPPPPRTPGCKDLDDDGDGVNNCDDRCPNSKAGELIGPDGCPVPAVSIDLRGVNFDFDKATLRPGSIETLSAAADILRNHPELRAEVAGHTDQCGKEGYNQKLSERRARVVYDYLTRNGVDASRLAGPIGYGESRPLEDMGQAFPACKSEKNRRTELNLAR
ncbi:MULTISPECIES: OmpA family protein [unclassified Lysobacter]|uniref:OmpA family protein n=1 Tax=unclassified Lysobacter TaxID=2635362 RepID=UPI001C21A9C8|nr:OmpA family protein [Lysobacter sp. MMG2]MBU8975293.1 OmpA family protein [Lysobacter sp. MMG2]